MLTALPTAMRPWIVYFQVEVGGKAWESRRLQPGDFVLHVNDVRCPNLQVAHELIDSAFSTLTLLLWR